MAEIVKVYTQDMPATRFIGKTYGERDRVDGSFAAKWDEFLGAGIFEKIRKAAGYEDGKDEFFEDSSAYIGLMRVKADEPFQYRIGMFTPAGTAVPEGLDFVDFEASKIGVGWVRGSEENGEIYCKEEYVIAKLEEQGHRLWSGDEGAVWGFERYVCPRYMEKDESGLVILDVCMFLEN